MFSLGHWMIRQALGGRRQGIGLLIHRRGSVHAARAPSVTDNYGNSINSRVHSESRVLHEFHRLEFLIHSITSIRDNPPGSGYMVSIFFEWPHPYNKNRAEHDSSNRNHSLDHGSGLWDCELAKIFGGGLHAGRSGCRGHCWRSGPYTSN